MALRVPNVLRLGPGGMRRLRARLGEADRAMAQGDWPLAETGYAATLAVDPARWPLHVQRGHALKEQGYLRRAEAAYREALVQKADVADTHLQLGHVLKLQGRIADAFAAYSRANRLAPDDGASRRELDALGTALPAPASSDSPARTTPDSPARTTPDAIARLLEAADLTQALLPLFDEVFYAANPSVRRDLPTPDRTRCLAHFCETGFATLLPIRADLVFDTDFYRETALGGRTLAPARAYRHWLTIGLAQGRAPNRTNWLDRVCGIAPRHAAALPPGAIDALVAMETTGAWIDGFDEMRAAGALSAASENRPMLACFSDRAARFAGGDAAQRATGVGLDARILSLAPDHAGALARTAGRLSGEGFAAEARPLFARLVGSGARSVEATLGLAACHEACGDPATALDVLAEGRRHFQGDTRLDRAFDALAPRLLHRAFRLALALGMTGAVAEADAALACAVDHVVQRSDPGTPPLARRPIRAVAIIGNGDLPQCRFYRIDARLEQCAALGIEAAFFDIRDGVPAFLGALHRFDAVIFYRVPADHAMIAAVTRCRAVGLLTLYETDDLIFDAAHYPDDLASYGGAIDAREYLGLRLGVPLMAAAMRLCDVGLASTPVLAEAMAPLVRSGRAVVHGNALGAAHEAAMRRPRPPHDDDRITLLYGSNTKAHAADFDALVAPALVEIVRRHGPKIRVVLVGHVPRSEALRPIESNVVRHPSLPLAAFWELLASADINLAVLKPSTMADAKSAIKWLEAALFGVPSVVSDTAAMRAAIDPGQDGFLCASPQAWIETLDDLIASPALRRAAGARARAKALARHGRQAATENLGTILRSLAPATLTPRPKLLVVNVYYPPQAIGGATRVVHDNVRSLVADGRFDVAVFTSTDGGAAPYTLSTYAQDGVRVTAVAVPWRDDIDGVLDDPAMGAAFAHYLASERPDLIHFHCVQRLTIAVVDAARETGIPYLITAHDGWWVSDEQFIADRFGTPRLFAFGDPSGTRRRLGASAEARMRRVAPALAGARRVLAVSEPFAALHRECGLPDAIAVPNGLSGTIEARRTPSAGTRLRLGFVGGMHDHKGWRLIEAALRSEPFDAFDLTVVDHAMPAGTTETTLCGATPVTFIPRVAPENVADLYGRIDVLLAPSLWPESFGLVTREALACGCWVVASDRGAIGTDIVAGENGFVVDAAGPDALVAALRTIAADPARYREAPVYRPPLRGADEQGRDLAALYATLLG
jgi:glycosyltransferase involved in cell wall biosynthesis